MEEGAVAANAATGRGADEITRGQFEERTERTGAIIVGEAVNREQAAARTDDKLGCGSRAVVFVEGAQQSVAGGLGGGGGNLKDRPGIIDAAAVLGRS